MKDKIIEIAKAECADIVGFAPASRFDADDAIFKIMPNVKTVIGFGFRLLRGMFRGIEEGTTYYQYTTMAVENMEETIMPMAQLKVSTYIESCGFTAAPQRRHQQIMSEPDSTNPEVAYDAVYRDKKAENQMDFLNAAIQCGLGEKGFHGALLTDEYGPLVRYCFVLTDSEIEPSDIVKPHLCDNCKKCMQACPGSAIDENGDVDPWQCAVYYNGANGTKNPFMPYDAFPDFKDRMDIISGMAKVDRHTAEKILDSIYFYPPAQHAYQCSICGRACDMECYVHLEQKGVLTKKYNTPFRKREKWQYCIEDFKNPEKH